ncbi:hypothetical protein PEX1_077200 [Penicillium expansum]|uniref:Uncharacterized protein n=1 Tax=Penicillium expansum TaxID=27334 RepID=A0A0A2IGC4_PENEN|nr:hypothetical protein PEX2_077580 [Penicillium expansum]KGO42109.1 hypothetical protein PEXP_050590 [Penicillium expansum]KGO56151.1 hypothetical protein PEX2_077580 [Penicillium expansum]KGO66828.1 hypothetical protein PEX1_077200 [Penicillium expansum]
MTILCSWVQPALHESAFYIGPSREGGWQDKNLQSTSRSLQVCENNTEYGAHSTSNRSGLTGGPPRLGTFLSQHRPFVLTFGVRFCFCK